MKDSSLMNITSQSLTIGQARRCLYKHRQISFILVALMSLVFLGLSGPHTVMYFTSESIFIKQEIGVISRDRIQDMKFNEMTNVQGQHLTTDMKRSAQQSDPQQYLPSVIVIGARKAGTGALLRFISLHPWVVTCKSEPHFFDRFYRKGLDWYRSQMPHSLGHQLTMEKTPNYFVDRTVPERVHEFNSSIRLILIVRDPIDRAVSDYVQLKLKFHKRNNSGVFGTFEDRAFDKSTGKINKSYGPIKRSLYSRHLDRWLSYFNRSQILILDGENIKVKPWEEMIQVERFLALPQVINKNHFVYNETKGFYCVKTDNEVITTTPPTFNNARRWSESCLGDTKGREHPKLSQQAKNRLQEYFTPFNERFYKRIGKRFDWNR